MKSKKHNWNNKVDFYQVHFRVLKKYQWRFLNLVNYKHSIITDQHEELEIKNGLIRTVSNSIVEIKIFKIIEVDKKFDREKARTFAYSYQAKLPSPDGRILIRYDSPHEDHNQFHHKHIFNKNGLELDVVELGSDEWPHVSEFLEEVITNF
jgi:hypothetical protein